jgi:hypothetical protein
MNNKGLKTPILIGTCLAALLPCLAMADAPSDAAVGQIDAILKFCVKTDPGLDKAAVTERALLIGNASPGALGSAAYIESYERTNQALAKVSTSQALAACTAGLNPLKSRDDGRH